MAPLATEKLNPKVVRFCFVAFTAEPCAAIVYIGLPDLRSAIPRWVQHGGNTTAPPTAMSDPAGRGMGCLHYAALALGVQRAEPAAMVALCVTGLERTFPLVAPNIAATHVDAVGRDHVDVFVVLDEPHGAGWTHHATDRKFYPALPYPGNLSVEEALGDFLKPVSVSRSSYAPPACGLATSAYPENTIGDKPGAINQAAYAKRNECWNAVQAREVSRGERYAWVISARSDVSYGMRLPRYEDWPAAPPGARFVCSEQLGHCVGPMTLNAGLEDQWGLVSRAAAPVYFEAVQRMHDRCLYRAVEAAGPCAVDQAGVKGGGLMQVCKGNNGPSASRLAIPLIAYGVNLCQLPIIPVDNKHIQRTWELHHAHDPRPRLSLIGLNASLPRAVYDLVSHQTTADGIYRQVNVPSHPSLFETYMREFERANGTLTYDLKLGVHGEPIAESHMHMNIRGRSREDRAKFDDQEAACAADVRRAIEETGWRLDSRRRNAR